MRNFLIAHVNFLLFPSFCMNIDEATAHLQAPLVLRRRKHCMIDMVWLPKTLFLKKQAMFLRSNTFGSFYVCILLIR